MAEKMTKARREMLADLLDGPKTGVMHYPPNKWALAQGYVTVRETTLGARVFDEMMQRGWRPDEPNGPQICRAALSGLLRALKETQHADR